MGNYRELCKLRISFFSACSSATGYFLGTPEWGIGLFMLFPGVFLLACGASALNQYQERQIDRLMPRTRGRPLPTMRIKPRHAFYFSLTLILSGFLFLFLIGGVLVSALGLLALIWYNGVYVSLKKICSFAVIPGALTGTIPPFMGWTAAGGAPSDPQILALCFFFFVWQIPHFWAVLLNHGEEYVKAGLPSLRSSFAPIQLTRICSIWMLAVAVMCMLIPLYGKSSSFLQYSLAAAAAWLFWAGIGSLRAQKMARGAYVSFYRMVNIYIFMVMCVISADKLLMHA